MRDWNRSSVDWAQLCICGAKLDAHTRSGRRCTCEQARRRSGYEPVHLARLLRLALERHTKAHQEAIDSIRKLTSGGFTARLGGRYKGFTVHGKTRGEIAQVVAAYFHEKWKQRRLRPRRV